MFYTFFAFLCIEQMFSPLNTKIVNMNQVSWQKTEADEGGRGLKKTKTWQSQSQDGTISALRTFLWTNFVFILLTAKVLLSFSSVYT